MSKHLRAILKGMAQAFDLTGSLGPRPSRLPAAQADYEALRSDWVAIGQDLEYAMSSFASEHQRATRR